MASFKKAASRRKGRPSIMEGSEIVGLTLKMTREQRDKLGRLGGAKWVRERIDRAKEPTK